VRGVFNARPAADTGWVRSHSTLAAVVVLVTLLVGVTGAVWFRHLDRSDSKKVAYDYVNAHVNDADAVWSIGLGLQAYIADMRRPRTPANRAELISIAQTQYPARLTFGSPDGGEVGRAEAQLTFAANELERAAKELFGQKQPTAAMRAGAVRRYTRSVNAWNHAVLTLWFAGGVSQDGSGWPVIDPPLPSSSG
jgi:hypothetical protein